MKNQLRGIALILIGVQLAIFSASYNSLGGGWTDIQTKAEHEFFSESASVYLQAFREARAEMQSSQPAPPAETSVDIRG